MSVGFSHVKDIANAIRSRWQVAPSVGLILGSGLGDLASHIQHPSVFPYAELPHLKPSTALGHAGQFVGGMLGDQPVIAMQGRFHSYEGHAADAVALPVRVMHALGATTLLVSNAAGGVNPNFRVGDIMVIDDHLNLMFRNPLVGANDPKLGERWPDMSSPYDRELTEIAFAVARERGFRCHRGVYVGMLGPTYETRAEYRMVRRIGGDAAGMSTVPEVIVASQLGLRVLGLSVITNACSPDQLATTTGDEVIAAATAASKHLLAIVERCLAVLGSITEGPRS